jgi:hypothetical protein
MVLHVHGQVMPRHYFTVAIMPEVTSLGERGAGDLTATMALGTLETVRHGLVTVMYNRAGIHPV